MGGAATPEPVRALKTPGPAVAQRHGPLPYRHATHEHRVVAPDRSRRVTAPSGNVCQRCGYASAGPAAFCRRCGLPFGAAPQVEAQDGPGECPVCYAHADRGGLFPAPGGGRTSYERHAYDHEVRPVGDDDWLETLRDGDQVTIGRWRAPYDLTRRYLVTGQWDAGAARTYVHNAVILAMVGAARDTARGTITAPPPEPPKKGPRGLFRRRQDPGPAADADPAALTDADLAAARRAVESLRERYLRGSRR
jgi:hypothetical protein